MFVTLRVFFTILSALCAAAVFPIGIFLGWGWAMLSVFGAFLFFIVMRIFKTEQEMQDAKNKPVQAEPDFLHPQDGDKY